MERAEEATISATSDHGIEQVEAPASVVGATRPHPLLVSVTVANLLLLGALVWSNRNIAGSLEAAQAVLTKQADATQVVNEKLAALGEKNDALEREVGQLREAVAARTTEDILFLKIVITKREIDRKLARDIARHVSKYARIYGQDPDLVLAMIAVESDFNPAARSYAGAVGLMQVMPQWKQVLGIQEELSDPETSIKYGLQILGFYRNMYRDLEMALTAYNRGPGPVDAALNRGQSPHNKYAPMVLRTYQELRSLEIKGEVG